MVPNIPRRPTPWMPLAVLALAALLAACGKNPESDAQPENRKKTAAAKDDTVSQETMHQKIASIGDWDITRQMLYWYANDHRNIVNSPREIFEAPPAKLRPALEDLTLAAVIEKHAADVLSTATLAEIDLKKKNQLILLLYDREVAEKLPPISDEEVKRYYNDNKEAFQAPLAFSIRLIFVSNYETVQTRPGETLETLAQRVSGDTAAVDRILVDNGPRSPRAPGWSTGDRTTIKPLEPGERLLVPMSADKKKQNLEKIEKAKARILAGEDFAAVAREISDSDTKGEIMNWVGTSGRPILPEIREAARKTETGKIGDIFETRHGYYLMKLESKWDDQPSIPLEAAADRIRKAIDSQRVDELMDAYAGRLFEAPDVKIDYAAFKNPATPPDTVIVSFDDKKYTVAQLRQSIAGPPATDMSDTQVMRILRINAQLQNDLFEREARRLEIDKTPQYRVRLAARVFRPCLDAYLEALKKRIADTPMSPEEARAYFETHRDEFNVPPAFTFYVLAARIPGAPDSADKNAPEAPQEAIAQTVERLAGWVRDIPNLEAFQQAVNLHSEDEAAKRTGGLVNDLPLPALSEAMRLEIPKLQVGRMSTAFRDGAYMKIAWLAEKKEKRPATYDEVRPNLDQLVKVIQTRKFPDGIQKEMIEKAPLVLVE